MGGQVGIFLTMRTTPAGVYQRLQSVDQVHVIETQLDAAQCFIVLWKITTIMTATITY